MNKLEEDKKQINKMLDNIYEGLEFEDDEDIRELYLKQKHALKTALNYIDNSISKEVIEEKIEEIRKARDTARDLIETKVVIADNDSLYSGQSIAHDYDINILKELLEQK